MYFKKFIPMFGIVSLLALSGCDGFAAPKSDAIIKVNDKCYILRNASIIEEKDNIRWHESFNSIPESDISTLDSKVSTIDGNYTIIRTIPGKSFTKEEIIQTISSLNIDPTQCIVL